MGLGLSERTPPENLDEILGRLGGVAPKRVRAIPPPGMATASDVSPSERPCELVDGTLVEKAMGYYESMVAILLARLPGTYVDSRDLGVILGSDAPVQMPGGQVRLPDVAFLSYGRLGPGGFPSGAILTVAPELMVEVLSEGNTSAEMTLKRGEYFQAGCLLVWEVDPRAGTVRVFLPDGSVRLLQSADTLSGDPVLPGFEVPVASLFPKRPVPGA